MRMFAAQPVITREFGGGRRNIFGIFLTLFSACAAAPPRLPAPLVIDHVVEVPVTRPCALRARPSYVPIPRPSPCMPGFICWPLAQFADLVDNTEALLEWAKEMERLCPPPASKPASSPAGGHP